MRVYARQRMLGSRRELGMDESAFQLASSTSPGAAAKRRHDHRGERPSDRTDGTHFSHATLYHDVVVRLARRPRARAISTNRTYWSTDAHWAGPEATSRRTAAFTLRNSARAQRARRCVRREAKGLPVFEHYLHQVQQVRMRSECISLHSNLLHYSELSFTTKNVYKSSL